MIFLDGHTFSCDVPELLYDILRCSYEQRKKRGIPQLCGIKVKISKINHEKTTKRYGAFFTQHVLKNITVQMPSKSDFMVLSYNQQLMTRKQRLFQCEHNTKTKKHHINTHFALS